MEAMSKFIIRELEEIKSRIISLEARLMDSEEPTPEERKALEESDREHKEGKTRPFLF